MPHCSDSPCRRGKYGHDRNQSCRIVLVPLDRRGAACSPIGISCRKFWRIKVINILYRVIASC